MSWMTKSLSSYYTLNVITNGARYLYFDEMETNCLVCEPLKEAGVKTNIHYVLMEDILYRWGQAPMCWITQFHQECLQFEKCYHGDPKQVFHEHFKELEQLLSDVIQHRTDYYKENGVFKEKLIWEGTRDLNLTRNRRTDWLP